MAVDAIAGAALQLVRVCWAQYQQMKGNSAEATGLCSRLRSLESIISRLLANPVAAARHADTLSALVEDLRAGSELAGEVMGLASGDRSIWERLSSKTRRFAGAGKYKDQLAGLAVQLDRASAALQLDVGVDVSERVRELKDTAATTQTLIRHLEVNAATRDDVGALRSELCELTRRMGDVRSASDSGTGARLDALATQVATMTSRLEALTQGASSSGSSMTMPPELLSVLGTMLSKMDELSAKTGGGSQPAGASGGYGASSPDAPTPTGIAAKMGLAPAPLFTLSNFSVSMEVVRRAAGAGFAEGDPHPPELLGSGSFGTVVRAALTLYGAPIPVAIKVFRGSAAAMGDSHVVGRVLDEAAFQYALRDHPNILLVYGVLLDRAAGVLGIVTEVCDGALDDMLYSSEHKRVGALSLPQQLDTLIQVANALAALHRRAPPIVHGDLKAANVLVSGALGKPGSIKLCDFGFARVIEDLSASSSKLLASSTGRLGTPLWRAPELFGRKAERPSRTSDMYAFGIMMWEVLTRSAPYCDVVPPLRDAADVKELVVEDERRPDDCAPAAKARLPRWTPAPLVDLMHRCWSTDKLERPASMDEVLQELLEGLQFVCGGKTPAAAVDSTAFASLSDSMPRMSAAASDPSVARASSPPPLPPPSAGPALPSGWSSALDSASGRTYYYNKDTKEVRWTLPEDSSVPPPPPPPPAAAPAPAPAVYHPSVPMNSWRDAPAPVPAPAPAPVAAGSSDAGIVARDLQDALAYALLPRVEELCASVENKARGDSTFVAEFGAANGMALLVRALRLQSASETLLTRACGAVINVSVDDDNEAKFGLEGGMQALVDMMRLHMSSAAVMAKACWAARNTTVNKQNQVAWRRADGMSVVADVLRRHAATADTVKTALWLVKTACVDDDNEVAFGRCGGMAALVTAARPHAQSTTIMVTAITGAVLHTTQDVTNRRAFGEAGGVQVLTDMLNRFVDEAEPTEATAQVLHKVLNADTANQKAFGDAGVRALVAALRAHAGSTGVMEHVCWAVMAANTDDDNEASFVRAGGAAALVPVLRSQIASVAVMRQACGALQYSCSNATHRVSFASAGALAPLLDVMRTHAREVKVMETACPAMNMLLTGQAPAQAAFGSAGGVSLIIEVLRNHMAASIVMRHALAVVRTSCVDDNNEAQFGRLGGIPLVVDALRRYRDDADVIRWACAAAQNTTVNKDNRVKFGSAGGMELLVPIMSRHMGADLIIAAACGVVRHTTPEATNKAAFGRTGGMATLADILRRHISSESVMDEACAGVNMSTSASADNQKAFGAAGGINALITVLQRHVSNATVMRQACWAVMNATIDDDNEIAFGASGGMSALVPVLRTHMDSTSVMEYAVGACRHVTSNASNRPLFGRAGGMQALATALSRHSSHTEIATHACIAANAAMSGVDENKEAFGEAGMAGLVSVLRQKLDVENTERVACVAARTASLNDANEVAFGRVGGMPAVVAVLRRYTSSVDVMKAACGALQNTTTKTENKSALANAGGADALRAVKRMHPGVTGVDDVVDIVLRRL